MLPEKYFKKLDEINKKEKMDFKILNPEDFKRITSKLNFQKTTRDGKIITFKMSVHNFFNNGHRGMKGEWRKRTTEEYKEIVRRLVGDEYSVIGEYTLSTKKILMRHNVCGREYEVQANEFLNGKRCAKCSGRMKLNTDIFKSRVEDLYGSEYEVIGIYTNSDTPIEIKHTKCGKKFSIPPKEFTGKKRRTCPFCTGRQAGISKGAKFVYELLLKTGKDIVREKKVNIDGRKYRFDFFLKPDLVIEYDGIQHFFEKSFGSKSENLETRQKYDEIKQQFALSNGWKILRIPFSLQNENIEEIISKVLKFNDQSQDVGNLEEEIFEMGGLLVASSNGARYDLNSYRKKEINKKNN